MKTDRFERILNLSETALRRAAGLFSAAGCLAVVLMFLLVSANIIGRPFGESIRGTVEMSGFLCALAVGLCLPGAQFAGSHISAGLCAAKLPKRFQNMQQGAISLCCCLLLGAAAAELMDIAAYTADMGEYVDGFGISYYGMIIGLAAGVGLHALVFFQAFCSGLYGLYATASRSNTGSANAAETERALLLPASGQLAATADGAEAA